MLESNLAIHAIQKISSYNTFQNNGVVFLQQSIWKKNSNKGGSDNCFYRTVRWLVAVCADTIIDRNYPASLKSKSDIKAVFVFDTNSNNDRKIHEQQEFEKVITEIFRGLTQRRKQAIINLRVRVKRIVYDKISKLFKPIFFIVLTNLLTIHRSAKLPVRAKYA